ncbi:unnamed protein product [Lepeophtheirus salmonis]|uniref:(salmon louse) hypothetical protein n=1 Tax=Lepeophtheirus salmonis TaxID=72036 RepID=A0A7R8HC18_LEPSM|nr:unnamed protein product [Lepeophtheirus salmonis]CAF2999500.1 unnamed protein product [Lepeophtheirus salmonis]
MLSTIPCTRSDGQDIHFIRCSCIRHLYDIELCDSCSENYQHKPMFNNASTKYESDRSFDVTFGSHSREGAQPLSTQSLRPTIETPNNQYAFLNGVTSRPPSKQIVEILENYS